MWTVLSLACVVLWTLCKAGTVTKGGDDSDDGPLSAEKFPYFATLDTEKNYELRWNFNSTHIMFKARVKTTGYIGLGISDHGSMFPSDVIIAWVKDGQVHFKDRHASGHFMPAVDTHQDWFLVSGSEDDQYTTITMVRPLVTCDDQDMDILPGTTRLIYSYSTTDPVSDSSIHYHGNTRGTKSVLLLDPPSDEDEMDKLPKDAITIDFRHQNYSVPSSDTTYACRTFKLPPLDGKHHMIRFEPVIQTGHEKLVHHMLVYYCPSDLADDMVNLEYICYEERPPALRPCIHVLVAWAIGGTPFNYPAHVGYSLGDVNDPGYFRLEVHYDNSGMSGDFVDSSGIRITLTKELRQHDAGVLEVGVNVNDFQIIPPHANSFLSRGVCIQGCIDKALGDTEIHVFADFLHSHLLGKRLSTRHIREGVELAPIMEDTNYDFNYQESRSLTEERIVKKGDTLITDCYYDSSKRDFTTYGGLSTREEMCLSYMIYYPKVPLAICNSRPRYNVTTPYQDEIFTVASKMDFTKKTERDKFADLILDDVTYICQIDGQFSFGLATPPTVQQPYVQQNQCTKN